MLIYSSSGCVKQCTPRPVKPERQPRVTVREAAEMRQKEHLRHWRSVPHILEYLNFHCLDINMLALNLKITGIQILF
jgi:hypothetical protein